MTTPDHPPRHSPRHWVAFAVLLAVAAALVYFFAFVPRQKVKREIAEQANERVSAIPKAHVVKVAPGKPTPLSIPGTTLAYMQAPIYARSSGYVTKRLVDIGDHVAKGQLLAVIDAPEFDQQVAQARSAVQTSEATLDQLRAQLTLSKANYERYKVLVAKGVFSRQEGETQDANYQSAQANVAAAQNTVQANKDNLRRLQVLQQYQHVTAPFSGVVTARNIDVGSLISGSGGGASLSAGIGAGGDSPNAGASGALTSSAQPGTGGAQGGQMFTISTLDPLRILAAVPEGAATQIHTGQNADVQFSAVPGLTVPGRVTRTARAIDANSRTLLTEVEIRNTDGKLMPGMSVVVSFSEAQTTPPLVVPGEAIVIRNGKTVVALVQNNHVRFTEVKLGRDFGDRTEVASGVKEGDLVVRGVSDEIQDGAEVQPIVVETAHAK